MWVAVAALTALALIVRLWWLDRVPPGLDPDEAAVAYNAYSIAHTGRDEYGQALPLAFRSYGDYKRPAYVYFSAPFVGLLGLTPFTARLPGAVAGTLCVPLLYVVARHLVRSSAVASTAAGLLSISPWAIQISRGGHEAGFFVPATLGMAAALLAALRAPARREDAACASASLAVASRGAARRAAMLWCGAAAAALLLAMYGYHSGVVVAPLLALAAVGIYWGRARRVPRAAVAVGLALLVAGLVPLVLQVIDGRATVRAAQTLLPSRDWITKEALAKAARNERDLAPPLAVVVSAMEGRWAIVGREVAAGYLAHFSPEFLFTRGDAEPRHHPPGVAQLYLWDAPLLVAGLAALWRGWRRPGYRLVALWLLLAPLPAAVSENAPHALRAYAMLPPLLIVAALGARHAWRWLGRRRVAGAAARGVGAALLACSLAFYAKAYYRDLPLEQDRAWSSGWLEAFRFAAREVAEGRARRIVVPPEVREGYAYALVAGPYDPREYLARGGSVVSEGWPLYPEPGPLDFAPWEVRAVDWQSEPRMSDALYLLGSWNQRPPDSRVLLVTRGASGRDALVVLRLG